MQKEWSFQEIVNMICEIRRQFRIAKDSKRTQEERKDAVKTIRHLKRLLPKEYRKEKRSVV